MEVAWKNEEVTQWLDQYGDYLYAYAMKKVHDKEVAFDLVQETLLGAWKASFHHRSSIKTWLIGILKHKVIDYIRKQIRDRKLCHELENDPCSLYFHDNGSWLFSPEALQLVPEQLAQNRQLQQHLMESIAELSEQQRTLFILRELNGESSAHICQTYGITPSNLHVIMHRARLALCRSLAERGYSGSTLRLNYC